MLAPYQVAHDGEIYPPGETADVPDDAAAGWLRAGWVMDEAEPAAKS